MKKGNRYDGLTPKERMANMSHRDEATGCIVWDGCTRMGYGYTTIEGRGISTHRAAWALEHGGIPPKMMVLHRCDNRRCMNVDHLFLGTAKDNAADMVSKGRHRGQRKVACKRGHPFTRENTYQRARGGRECLACVRERSQRNYAERGEELRAYSRTYSATHRKERAAYRRARYARKRGKG